MLAVWQNPIFRREFRVDTRCRKTLAMTLCLVASLAGTLVVLWPRTGVFSEINSNEIFTVFLNLNLALILLLVPAFVATTVTQERERHTFELLFTSLLTPAEILTGKLFSSLAITFLVVIASMPITAVCALSGGIGVGLLTRAYGVILLATLCYGLFGLALSALCCRSFTALVLTYVGILLLAGATWVPSVLLGDAFGLGGLWGAVRALSPFEALFAMNHPERYELAVTGLRAPQVLRLHLLGMSVLGFGSLVVFCLFVLRPLRRRKAQVTECYADRRTAFRRTLCFPFYLVDPLRRKRPIGRWRNPVYVAEIRSRVFGKPKVIVRSLSAILVASMLLLLLTALQFATRLDPDTVRCVAIVFQFGVVAFFAPAVCSGSITDERTSGTLVLLRMTGLPVRTVVWGKIKAGFLYTMIFLASSIPVLLALSYLEARAAYWRIGAWLLVLVLTTVVFVCMGLCASTFSPTTGAATAVSYGFAAAMSIGTLGVLLFGSRIAPPLKAAVLALNPVVAALQISSDTLFAELPKIGGHPLWLNNVVFLAVLCALLAGLTSLRVKLLFAQRE
ncbi:MAG: ABC transporter permease [Lentisphaeria bacterium]|nr:ABC transporter permease [Lentisphaeria bacterium]